MPDTQLSLVHRFINDERHITDETLDAFGVRRGTDTLDFPYGDGVYKSRRHDADGKRHFSSPKGTIPTLFQPQSLCGNGIVFLVEGETDTLRLYQELGTEYDVFGIPGVNTWRDEWAEGLKGYDEVFVILDNDADYKVSAVVDRAWMAIRRSIGPRARRINLPDSVNDICEFFDTFDLDSLRELANRAVDTGSWHYEALDLGKPLQSPDWLVDELIAKGDLTMMIGEPGVGKSWVSMLLAVSVAEGWESFMGKRLLLDGGQRVLYVDEENPEMLIPYRLRKLGLSNQGMKNIRFLHQQGVKLDKHPDYILEEALDYSPTLIVLDSLTRIHTQDENNAGAISTLFNDGILPLVRSTGATLLVLHHVNKSDSTSSFTRARGSSDLSGVIDCGLDITGKGEHSLTMKHYKSRWIGEGGRINFKIEDTPDGLVSLVVHKDSGVF